MKYEELVNELSITEVRDINSALKTKLLQNLINVLDKTNRDKTHKIVFSYDDNLDNAIYFLENKVNEMIEQYKNECIGIMKNREKTKSRER